MFRAVITRTSGGHYVCFDVEDADLTAHKWTAKVEGGRQVYAQREVRLPNGKRTTQLLHRAIGERIAGRALLRTEHVDHVNCDTTNNQRSNLRVVTHSQNLLNRRGANKNSSSGFRNVYPHRQKWQAQGELNGKTVSLGLFVSPADASECFAAWATVNYGAFFVDTDADKRAAYRAEALAA